MMINNKKIHSLISFIMIIYGTSLCQPHAVALDGREILLNCTNQETYQRLIKANQDNLINGAVSQSFLNKRQDFHIIQQCLENTVNTYEKTGQDSLFLTAKFRLATFYAELLLFEKSIDLYCQILDYDKYDHLLTDLRYPVGGKGLFLYDLALKKYYISRYVIDYYIRKRDFPNIDLHIQKYVETYSGYYKYHTCGTSALVKEKVYDKYLKFRSLIDSNASWEKLASMIDINIARPNKTVNIGMKTYFQEELIMQVKEEGLVDSLLHNIKIIKNGEAIRKEGRFPSFHLQFLDKKLFLDLGNEFVMLRYQHEGTDKELSIVAEKRCYELFEASYFMQFLKAAANE